MPLTSKQKHWIYAVGILAIVIAAFVGGCFAGPKIFVSDNNNPSSANDAITATFDSIGRGEIVLRREFWGIPFGTTRHDIQTHMDGKWETFDFVESENFPHMFIAKYMNAEIDSTFFPEIRFYFYKEKLAMVMYKFNDQHIQSDANSILADLESKYGNLNKLAYSSKTNTIGALRRKRAGIDIPEFYPQWDRIRLKSLRDGHTILNLFDLNEDGVFILYYDRLSNWQEDANCKRKNAL